MLRITVLLMLTGCVGCGQTAPKPNDTSRRNELAFHINTLLVKHHSRLASGLPRDQSLNVDAFDFMLGKSTTDFPVIFGDKKHSLKVEEAKAQYPDFPIANWMAETQDDYEDRLRFDILWTQIGLTFGYEAQCDYLVLAQSNDVIVAWELFAITDY